MSFLLLLPFRPGVLSRTGYLVTSNFVKLLVLEARTKRWLNRPEKSLTIPGSHIMTYLCGCCVCVSVCVSKCQMPGGHFRGTCHILGCHRSSWLDMNSPQETAHHRLQTVTYAVRAQVRVRPDNDACKRLRLQAEDTAVQKGRFQCTPHCRSSEA